MKKRFGFWLFLSVFLSVFALLNKTAAQSVRRPGQWTSYLSHQAGKQVIIRDKKVYMISNAGLVTVDIETKTRNEYSRIDGLSSLEPQTIYYDSTTNYVFIAYTNGLLDYFQDTEGLRDIRTMRDLYLTTNVFDKTIYNLFSHKGYLYMACAFGVVVYDIAKEEIRYTYTKFGTNDAEKPVYSVAAFNERLYVGMDTRGLYSAALNNPNLQDASAWRRESGDNGLPDKATKFVVSNGSDLFVQNEKGFYQWNKSAEIWEQLPYPTDNPTIPDSEILEMRINESGFNFIVENGFYLYSNGKYSNRNYNFQPKSYTESQNGHWRALADNHNSLVIFENGLGYYESPRGLPNNKCNSISIGDGKLFVAPSQADVEGLFYLPKYGEPWRIYSDQNVFKDQRVSYNFFRVLYNDETDETYAVGYLQGVVKLKDTTILSIFDNENGCLKGFATNPDQIFVTDMAFDAKGNLWLSSNTTEDVISVITPKGVCYTYPPTQPTWNQLMRVIVDNNGYKWFLDRINGVMVYDDKGTPDNRFDDKAAYVRTGAGAGNLPGTPLSMAVDLEGAVWVGTIQGVAVYYNSYAVLSGQSPDGVCPIFNQQCLLKDENVSAIAVDAANRKWIGTTRSGVYLVSADGTKQLLHLTAENSPLISNTILDIKIDHATGEIFFATNSGLVSYMGDATENKENFDELYAFPNPVYTDYTGDIRIRGGMRESVVRIVTVAGNLVRELTSNGGETVWDGRDTAGTRVRSGIYIVLFSDKDGSNAGSVKIAVIER